MKTLVCSAAALICLTGALSAGSLPSWWTTPATQILQSGAPENNYALLNAGQLKYVATQAKSYLDANVNGGSGTAINTMLAGFSTTGNFNPVNVGQLKAVAKPFYDRLLNPEVNYNTKQNLINRGLTGWSSSYPWGVSAPENYAPANIGQLKMVFSFSLNEGLNSHVREQIDLALAGKSAGLSLSLWNNRSGADFALNPNRWTGFIDVSCIPARPVIAYGALISPRHVIMAKHTVPYPGAGETFIFVKADGTKISRVLTATMSSPGNNNVYPDWRVGILDSDVPAGITPTKVLPDNWSSKLTFIRGIPAIGLNQFGELTVRDAYTIDSTQIRFVNPTNPVRLSFYRDIILNDSGSPVFLVVNHELILLSVWTYGVGGAGTFIVPEKASINAAMHNLSVAAGATTDYDLTEVDLNGFSL